jgi:hypothetical protein
VIQGSVAVNEPKPFASLGPTLLARKGGAKPAMRPQLGAMPTPAVQPVRAAEPDLDDLGWNDMGHHEDEAVENPVVALVHTPPNPEKAPEPEVRRQQRAVAATLAPEPARLPQALPADPRRAAFTLRLDSRRHLKLRLASTVKNRSAQALVTQALDKFLAEIPELEALAAQLHRD